MRRRGTGIARAMANRQSPTYQERASTDTQTSSPARLPRPAWFGVLRRTIREFRDDNLTDWAAALTYYAVLALFPALLVLVALVGLFGQYPRTTDSLLEIVGKLGPKS